MVCQSCSGTDQATDERVDGKLTTDGIRKALGMFDLRGTSNLLRLTLYQSWYKRRRIEYTSWSVSPHSHIYSLLWLNAIQGNQFQENVRRWLSPPDPSTNHNIARRNHLDGTASWFTQSVTLKDWKETGSLLWIHGKRTRLSY